MRHVVMLNPPSTHVGQRVPREQGLFPDPTCGQVHGPPGQGLRLKKKSIDQWLPALILMTRSPPPHHEGLLGNPAVTPDPDAQRLHPSLHEHQDAIPQMSWALMDSQTGDLQHK